MGRRVRDERGASSTWQWRAWGGGVDSEGRARAASTCLAVVAGKAEAVAESAQVLGRDGDRVAALALEAVLGAHRGQQLAHRVLRPAHELVELGGELVRDPVGAPSEVAPRLRPLQLALR